MDPLHPPKKKKTLNELDFFSELELKMEFKKQNCTQHTILRRVYHSKNL